MHTGTSGWRASAAVIVLSMCSTACLAHPGHGPDSVDRPAAAAIEARQRVESFEKRLADNPGDARLASELGSAWLKLARITTAHDDFAKAERAFRETLNADPSSEWAPLGLAYALVGQHRFGEALVEARRAAVLQPDEPGVTALIGDVHLAIGNIAEARAIFGHLMARELTLESLSRGALGAQAAGDLDTAIALMRDAAEAGKMLGAKDSAISWCRSMLGDFAFERGDRNSARAEWDASLLLNPSCHHAVWRLAELDMAEGRADRARDSLETLVKEFPKPVYLVSLGDAWKRAGGQSGESRAAECWANAEQLMVHELEHGGPGHARELVEFWLSHGGDPAKAAELALRDLNEVRQDPGAFDTAAWALFRAGRTSEAVPLARQSVLRLPADARSLARAGLVLWEGGDKAEGRRLLALARARKELLEPSLAEAVDRAVLAGERAK